MIEQHGNRPARLERGHFARYMFEQLDQQARRRRVPALAAIWIDGDVWKGSDGS